MTLMMTVALTPMKVASPMTVKEKCARHFPEPVRGLRRNHGEAWEVTPMKPQLLN